MLKFEKKIDFEKLTRNYLALEDPKTQTLLLKYTKNKHKKIILQLLIASELFMNRESIVKRISRRHLVYLKYQLIKVTLKGCIRLDSSWRKESLRHKKLSLVCTLIENQKSKGQWIIMRRQLS